MGAETRVLTGCSGSAHSSPRLQTQGRLHEDESTGCPSPWVLLEQVILGEIFSDYTPAQVVVKELRASAGPLEQRKFISEAQPYRYGDLWVDMEP